MAKAAGERRHAALALVEWASIAAGLAAADRMVKAAPIALLRAGTVHPGRYLVLVGGSVAATEVAFAVADSARELDGVFLGDVHPQLHDAVVGERRTPGGDALAVLECATSPALLRGLDAAVKGTDVEIVEVRLADDLGGKAVGLLSGDLTTATTALELAAERAGEAVLGRSLLPRLDDNLRALLATGSAFAPGPGVEPAGAEYPEEVACSWDG